MGEIFDMTEVLQNLRKEVFEGLKPTQQSNFDSLAEYYAEKEMHNELLLLMILEKLTKSNTSPK